MSVFLPFFLYKSFPKKVAVLFTILPIFNRDINGGLNGLIVMADQTMDVTLSEK